MPFKFDLNVSCLCHLFIKFIISILFIVNQFNDRVISTSHLTHQCFVSQNIFT
jgi:hypothetical protein